MTDVIREGPPFRRIYVDLPASESEMLAALAKRQGKTKKGLIAELIRQAVRRESAKKEGAR